ncbi:hypothetical protein R6Q57_012207 [Mikania cordata]
MDAVIHHPWLQFPQGTVARSRRDRLLRKEMGQQNAIDYDLLAELGQLERMTAIICEDTPWSRLFEMTFAPQYRLITVEFLSTFVFTPPAADQPQQQQLEVSFRLCGLAYAMSLAEFGNALGLYTEEELTMLIYTSAIHTADDAVVSAWENIIIEEKLKQEMEIKNLKLYMENMNILKENEKLRKKASQLHQENQVLLSEILKKFSLLQNGIRVRERQENTKP